MIKTLAVIVAMVLGAIVGSIICAVSGAYLLLFVIHLVSPGGNQADLGAVGIVLFWGFLGFSLGGVSGAFLGALAPLLLGIVVWSDEVLPRHRHEIPSMILGIVIGPPVSATAGSLLLGGGLWLLLFFVEDLSFAKEIVGLWGAFMGASVGGLCGLLIGPWAGLLLFRSLPQLRRQLGLAAGRAFGV